MKKSLSSAVAIVALLLCAQRADAYSFLSRSFQSPAAVSAFNVHLQDGNTITSIPPGSQRVVMGTILLQAPCNADVAVESITLWHRGAGSAGDIDGVYGMSGGQRITRSRPIESGKGEVTLHFRSFVVPACETREIAILADFSADAAIAGEHRLELRSSSDVVATQPATLLTAPRAGIRRTVGPAEGSISVSYLQLNEPVRYGDRRRVARFRLDADSSDDHVITAITFTNQGSARDGDLRNLFVESSRLEQLSDIALQMEGDHVRLLFDPPLFLPSGENRVMSLRADIRASRRKTIQFLIEEAGDIEDGVVRNRRL